MNMKIDGEGNYILIYTLTSYDGPVVKMRRFNTPAELVSGMDELVGKNSSFGIESIFYINKEYDYRVKKVVSKYEIKEKC